MYAITYNMHDHFPPKITVNKMWEPNVMDEIL